MLYTLGHHENYTQGLRDFGEDFRKLGKTETYGGGSVWLTREDAQHVADVNPGFSVWGLDTDISNTYKNEDARFLIASCRIIPAL